MKSYVKTATGKVFNAERCFSSVFGGYQQLLRIFFDGYSIMDIVPVFADPAENTVITFYDAEVDETQQYSGYETLLSASYSIEDKRLTITLTTQKA